ncbi:MAG: mandelate racemase [Planctomycetaceae bacterium]|nr:mandelate racemase [Planctomycetaceae bacterium]
MIPNDRTGGIIYSPGTSGTFKNAVLQVHTDAGLSGEHVVSFLANLAAIPMFAKQLVGQNALERERLYQSTKFTQRGLSGISTGVVDCALWDIAGKYYNAPVYELLGGYRKRLTAYASTYHGDEEIGGLNSPEAYADFAEQCLELGYKAFKIHGWEEGPVEREIKVVQAVRDRVGDRMMLMNDPACAINTFGDAWRVGRACDEAGFFWLEDPFKDGGLSIHAHRKLRQKIKTPLLVSEHVNLLEPTIDFAMADATDFVRADTDYDGGITGVMKIAHAAEGLGLDTEVHLVGPARRHCIASIRNANFYEMGLVHPRGGFYGPPIFNNGYRDALDAIDADGCVSVPEGPGLGVQLDWDYIRRRRTAHAVYD